MYAEAGASNSVIAAVIKANLSSELAVAAQCGDDGTKGHRFNYVVPKEAVQFSGAKIYMHGISTTGKPNSLLDNSGKFSLPIVVEKPCDFNGIKIESNQSMTRFEKSAVPYEQECKSEVRTCKNGVLSGSYTQSSCQKNSQPTGKVLGVIDGITKAADGTSSITGWACEYATGKQTDIHMYLYAQAGTSNSVIAAVIKANLTSEAAVATQCGDNGSLGHRFKYVIPKTATQYPGAKIYMHGISTTGKANSLLDSSGVYALPIPEEKPCYLNGVKIESNKGLTLFEKSVVPYEQSCKSEVRTCKNGVLSGSYTQSSCLKNTQPTGKVLGVIDGITKAADGTSSITGWACDYGTDKQIDIHIYLNASAGSPGSMIAAVVKANLSSESAVATQCGDNGSLGHRFKYVIPKEGAQFSGASIFIHGISVSGKTNDLLFRSGQFLVP